MKKNANVEGAERLQNTDDFYKLEKDVMDEVLLQMDKKFLNPYITKLLKLVEEEDLQMISMII